MHIFPIHSSTACSDCAHRRCRCKGPRASDFPRLIQLAENIYAYEDLMGENGTSFAFTTNSLIVVTDEGVLVADAQGSLEKTQRMIDVIAGITDQPIRYLVVCADHGDHVAGNAAFPEGTTFISHPRSRDVLAGMAARGLDIPIPQETVSEQRNISLGDTDIQILFLGRANTGGDLHVYLPEQDILFMSESFFNRLYPSVGGSRSAYPIEWIETIRRAQAIEAEVVIPGHGFVDDPAILQEELVKFRQALENLVAESTRLHDQGVPAASATRQMNLGEFQYWYRAVNNLPDAVSQVYRELDGELP